MATIRKPSPKKAKDAKTLSNKATYYELVGQLLSQKNNIPLPNYTVEASEAGIVTQPNRVGADITNGRGHFLIRYPAPANLPQGKEKTFQLTIRDPKGVIIDQQTIKVEVGEKEVIPIMVALPDRPFAAFDDIRDYFEDKSTPSAKWTELITFLEEQDIHSIDELRRSRGIGQLDFPDPEAPEAKTLDALARLSVLDNDLEALGPLVKKGYQSIGMIANQPRTEFVADMAGELEAVKANQLYRQATAQSKFLTNLLTYQWVEQANGRQPSSLAKGLDAEEERIECSCRDCESAVSPLAYLANLLRYALQHLREDGHKLALTDLTDYFHQPFAELPASCKEMNNKVRQGRLCIEVLRRLSGNDQTTDPQYLLAAYQAMLNQIGTSYEEIRLARTAKPEVRRQLAEKLGIGLSQQPPDELERLYRAPDAITEQALEDLFGLVDTRRNPLGDGYKYNDQDNMITHWRFDGLKWGKNTGVDGKIYLRLSKSQNKNWVRVYRDAARENLVAEGFIEEDAGPVKLNRVGLHGISGKLVIDRFQEAVTINFRVFPLLLSWRLQHLRTRWSRQEWPDDAFSEGNLPVIDPDLIGPDDFRAPFTGSKPFDLWQYRRTWVDDRIRSLEGLNPNPYLDPDMDVILNYMAQSFEYPDFFDPNGTPFSTRAWNFSEVITRLDQLHDQLMSGQDTEQTIVTIRSELKMTVESFRRLMEIKVEDSLYKRNVQEEPVSADTWRELYYLLTQVFRQCLIDEQVWQTEEEQLRQELGEVIMGPRYFWQSLREPVQGEWPIVKTGDTPLIDPDRQSLKDLPESVIGQAAIELWNSRRTEIQQLYDELKAIHNNPDNTDPFEAMLRTVFPQDIPGGVGSWGDYLDTLQEDLLSGDPQKEEEAQRYIVEDLQMTMEDFERLMLIKAKNDQSDPALQPTPEEWSVAYGILTRSYKIISRYPQWVEEEGTLTYYELRKANLPIWRTDTERRKQWSRALTDRCRAPIIDCDLINEGDLAEPLGDNAAYGVWVARRIETEGIIENQLKTYPKDLDGFRQAWSDFVMPETSTAPWKELERLPLQQEAGEDIRPRLQQLGLSFPAYDRLCQLNRLLESPGQVNLTDGEWEDLQFILLQVWKQRNYGQWRFEEKHLGIVCSPDFFRLYYPEKLELHEWRSDERARRLWQDRVADRIGQEENTRSALTNSVSDCEAITLNRLRDALIGESGKSAKWLTEHLLIDFETDSCQLTTRIAQAITTIQQLIHSVHQGRLKDLYPNLLLTAEHFDEEWKWMGSYESWRAAAFVLLYPQNILLPSLRKWQTPAFRNMVRELRDDRGLTPEMACRAADRYARYFEDVCKMQVKASVQALSPFYQGSCRNRSFKGHRYLLYLIGQGRVTQKLYYSYWEVGSEADYAQSFWTAIPGLEEEKVSEVLGASVYEINPEERHIYLFVKATENAQQKLLFTRYDLQRGNWTSEVNELAIPEDAKEFDAVVKQTSRDADSPQLTIHLPGGAMYARHLNRAGADWEEDDWRKLVGPAKGRQFENLCAMIETKAGEFVLFANVKGKKNIQYRLFGQPDDVGRDDGFWRNLGVANNNSVDRQRWLGGLSLPSDGSSILAYLRNVTGNTWDDVSIDIQQQEVAIGQLVTPRPSLVSFCQLDYWLTEVVGVSLSNFSVDLNAEVIVEFSLENEGAQHLTGFLETVRVSGDDNRTWIFNAIFASFIEAIESEEGSPWEDLRLADSLLAGVTGLSEQEENPVLKQLMDQLFYSGGVPFNFRGTFSDPCVPDEEDSDDDPGSEDVQGAEEGDLNDSGQEDPNDADQGGPVEPGQGSPGDAEQGIPTVADREAFDPYEEVSALADSIVKPWDRIAFNVGESDTHEIWGAYDEDGLHLAQFTEENDLYEPTKNRRISPKNNGFYHIAEYYDGLDLQQRKLSIERNFSINAGGPAALLTYLEEAWYFVPVHIALQLQRRRQFQAALNWFRTVYDYTHSNPQERNVYPRLQMDQDLPGINYREADWLLDPLNPHAIAATRNGTYARFTIIFLISCLLEYADAEFTQDTAESIPRARTLYQTALELLEVPELEQQINRCRRMIEKLRNEFETSSADRILDRLDDPMDEADQVDSQVWDDIREWVQSYEEWVLDHEQGRPYDEVMAGVNEVINDVLNEQRSVNGMEEVVPQADQITEQAQLDLLANDPIMEATVQVGSLAGEDFARGMAIVTGERLQETNLAEGLVGQNGYYGVDDRTFGESVLYESGTDVLLEGYSTNPDAGMDGVQLGGDAYVPLILTYKFCIPSNPLLKMYRLKAELSLYNIRHCRNIAGIKRELEPYAAPTDTYSGMPVIGAGGQLVVPGVLSSPPSIYRYEYLVERAKQIAERAAQLESAFLAALEKRDAEYYNVLKAKQEIQLSRAGVRLQDIRVREAQDGVKLAELQRERAQIQVEHYSKLLEDPISFFEEMVLHFYTAAYSSQLVSALLSVTASTYSFSGGFISMDQGFSNLASASSSMAAFFNTLASQFSTLANYERRQQEWEFQRTLGSHDVVIGSQQIRLAKDRVKVVDQERSISKMQADFAKETADFLANKFTNAELYDWMSTVLEGVYSFFLQQATGIAKMAERQLAFERQEMPPSYIQADYWEAPSDDALGFGMEKGDPDRRGLTGSARLLADIYRLDQYRFDTEKRKLQLTKNISLAQMAPFEFQRFRETGVLRFGTPLSLFDREFPGHYLRLIKQVRTSVIALIPPNEGIKASLSTTGLSRIVIGTMGLYQTILQRRQPESVALTAPTNSTGMFELNRVSPEVLLPFEGMGVATEWEFRMPKAANRFDYRAIADIILTIDYTALESWDYQQQVIKELDPKFSASRAYSFRHQFADAWYDLHNTDPADQWISVDFRTTREDFPPNLDDLDMDQLLLFFASQEHRMDGKEIRLSFVPDDGEVGVLDRPATPEEGVISTTRGNGSAWTEITALERQVSGTWTLKLPNTFEVRQVFEEEQMEDILFVITYSGWLPDWPE